MESLINLDLCAREIDKRRPRWRALGFDVGPTTWRDQGQGWPPRISEDRAQVHDADSVGVRATRTGSGELDEYLELVLYRGGWIDWMVHTGRIEDDPLVGSTFDREPLSVEDFGRTLDQIVGHLG